MSLTTISAGRVSARIDSMGAQLTSLSLDGREYLWQADPAWWGKHAPILFPIVGSLRGDAAMSAQGPCRMPRHGLARIREHAVAEVAPDGSSVTFELSSDAETLAAYPYPFVLRMTYAVVAEDTLAQTFTVVNAGDAPMPFAVGGHPAFNVPAPAGPGDAAGETFEECVVRLTRPWTCEAPVIAEGGLLDYEHAYTVLDEADELPLTHGLFDRDAVVLSHVPDSTVTLVGTKTGRGVRMSFPGFNHIGIWSALGDAPFVALEPWTGHATLTTEDDVFEHKRDVIILQPGETCERTFTMTLM